jgi:heme/copper-type cytochrome/quinol oxidase subunit 2
MVLMLALTIIVEIDAAGRYLEDCSVYCGRSFV